MKRFIFISWFVLELILCHNNTAIAGSGYYRWQDAQGSWHFSDRPPITPSAEVNISKVSGKTVNSSKPPIKAIGHSPLELKDQPDTKPSNITLTKQQLKQQKICHTLKLKLDVIQKRLRTGYKEPKGNQLRAQRRQLSNKIYQQC